MRSWLLLLLVWMIPLQGYAIDLNFQRMLSPGPLSAAHQKYEKDCKSCHSDFEKKSQNNLCLDCHKDVAGDIKTGAGFHGKKPGIAGSECRLCHSEHKGLKADIVQLNQHSFDHSFTDFPLTGLHTQLSCNQCHSSGKKLREAPHQCIDCHRKDDIHKGSQGTACGNCHSASGWNKTTFDHSKTHFPLHGAHAGVSCNQCHRSSDFKQAQTACISCHKIDDVHLNSFGTQCNSCHTETRWKDTRFNHDKDTHFKLLGAHKQLQCAACHTMGTIARDLPQTCVGCHRNDDAHFGKNGDNCGQCHNNVRWSNSRFDHSKTRFPLHGAHQQVRCEQCHLGNVHAPIKNFSCAACHNEDDVHKKSLGEQCQQCHNESGWRDHIRFDHDLTQFPLLGMHATVACESCHDNFQFTATTSTCISCHKADDPHKGTLGTQCASCHHPAGWNSWHFNHDKQTRFPLTGAHAGLTCDSCHKQPLAQLKGAGNQCGQCHQADDIHRGAYGMQCDTCHDTRNFSTLHMR